MELETFIKEQENKTIAVSVQDLQTRQQIHIQADEAFHPASTIKVHVMMEVFHQAAQGSLSLEDQLPVVNSFTSIADGSSFCLREEDDSEKSLYALIGQSVPVRELTRLMIVRSSNLATNILLERTGAANVNAFLQALGIEGVTLLRGVEDNAAFRRGMNNSASARGLTHTMTLLAQGRVVSTDASDRMIAILLEQEFNESIPALLPAGVRVAHKTGWTGNVYHDTGIVYPAARQPYAITIMTRGFGEDQEEAAHACMAHISRLVYERLQ